MAFPQTAAPTVTAFGSFTTAHAVDMPATVNSGDLLIVIIAFEGQSALPSVTTPSGWTRKWIINLFPTAILTRGGGYVKVADGTEDGGTVDFVTSVNATGAAQCYRVTNWFGSLTGVEHATTGGFASSTSPNPPNLSPSWPAEDTLWYAFGQAGNDDQAFTGAPTNYTNLTSTVSGGGEDDGCEVGSARRERNDASENPSSFTLASTEAWIAQTLAVRQFTKEPPTAELVLTTTAPNVALSIGVPAANLTLTTTALTVLPGVVRTVPTAELSLTLVAASLNLAKQFSIPTAQLALSTAAPLQLEIYRAVPSVDLALTPVAPTASHGPVANVPAADLALSTFVASVVLFNWGEVTEPAAPTWSTVNTA